MTYYSKYVYIHIYIIDYVHIAHGYNPNGIGRSEISFQQNLSAKHKNHLWVLDPLLQGFASPGQPEWQKHQNIPARIFVAFHGTEICWCAKRFGGDHQGGFCDHWVSLVSMSHTGRNDWHE